MSIAKMKKISVLALCKDRDDLLQKLMELGCVEISETRSELTPDECALFQEQDGSVLDEARARASGVEAALTLLGEYCPEKTGMFKVRKEVSRDHFFSEEKKAAALKQTEEILALSDQIQDTLSAESRLRSRRTSLTPWQTLDVPLDYTPTGRIAVLLGACPASFDTDEIAAELTRAVPESELTLVHSDMQQHYLYILCLRERESAALGILRTFEFTQTVFRDFCGTAAQNIDRLDREIEDSIKKRGELTEEICVYKPSTSALKTCWDSLQQDIAREEARQRLVSTRRAFQLEGWLPAAQQKNIEEFLSGFLCAFEVKEPEEGDNVPIQLRNNAVTKPFTLVTAMYSMPDYHGVDPNPLIAPFFIIFFGMMYSDIGYGLLVSLISFVIIKKTKPKGYLLSLMFLCGFSSIIFGALMGSFFGNSIPTVAELLGLKVTAKFFTKPLLDPLNDPITVLFVSYGIGFIHIMYGMAINAYMLIRDGKWKDAIFDVGSWWLLFAGIAVLAFGGTFWIAVAGAVMIVTTAGREYPGIGGKIGFGLYGLYNITGYVGDILSYTRLMTLMLAGAVIANVVNILGSIAGNIIIFIPIFIVGHAFNMAINIIGTYVHTSRLIYLEFFSKFYREGGRMFKPLAINTKYVDIVKEEN